MTEEVGRLLEPEAISPLPWASRASSMPYLPGVGGARQVELLAAILDAVVEHDGLATERVRILELDPRPLQEWANRLPSAGLVSRLDRDHYEVSTEGLKWRSTGDPLDLLAVFHRHVRYLGELMDELTKGPQSTRLLQEIANRNYGLGWATLDQVRRRLMWMTCLGMVEYKTTHEVGLTNLGQTAVRRLAPGTPDQSASVDIVADAALPEVPAAISELLSSLTQQELAGRNPVLGYVPRGNGETDVVEALTSLVNACVPQASRADLLTFAGQKFGVSEGSFGAVLTTLTKSGLIEQIGVNIYSPTSLASAWLEDGSPLSLVLLLHSRFRVMLEVIPLLGEFDQAPALARAAAQQGWLNRPDAGGIRTRLQLLKAAGLIFERASWKYQATPLGELVAQEYPLQDTSDDDTIGHAPEPMSPASLEERSSQIDALVSELEAAGTAGEDAVRLERAVAEAFNNLGFEARHIGGGGQTDVLATVDDGTGRTARVIIDAKAARSGVVSEGAVSFDTLREHKKKHQADHVVLVGPSFESGRTKQRAAEHGVRVLTVSELNATLQRHSRVPQSPASYLRLVSAEDAAQHEQEAAWRQSERRLDLLGHVTAVLASEAQMRDEITGGALTADQIYLIVRDEIDPRPAAADIEEVLRLLEHPLVDSVIRLASSSKAPAYQLKDPVALVASKLAAVVRAVKSVEVDG